MKSVTKKLLVKIFRVTCFITTNLFLKWLFGLLNVTVKSQKGRKMLWISLILLSLLALIECQEKDYLKLVNKYLLPAALLIIAGPLLILYYTKVSAVSLIFYIVGIIQAAMLVGLYFLIDKYVVSRKKKNNTI